MCELRRIALGALAISMLSFCGVREAGNEVLVTIESAATGASGTLDVGAIELLACPDAPGPSVWRVPLSPSRALAHDADESGALVVLALPAAHDALVLPIDPGVYCDVRLRLGAPDRAALVTATGEAAEREVVIRLVDAAGEPTRVVLGHVPTQVALTLSLGAFDAGDAPEHALGRLVDEATVRVSSAH
jgi:hypothetical protein